MNLSLFLTGGWGFSWRPTCHCFARHPLGEGGGGQTQYARCHAIYRFWVLMAPLRGLLLKIQCTFFSVINHEFLRCDLKLSLSNNVSMCTKRTSCDSLSCRSQKEIANHDPFVHQSDSIHKCWKENANFPLKFCNNVTMFGMLRTILTFSDQLRLISVEWMRWKLSNKVISENNLGF